jgi:putative ABC transport system permease protein
MDVVWHKVWRDLWRNKSRTFLVVLSTAVGVFALGLTFGLSGVMRDRMTESHRASEFPHILFYTGRFPQEVVDAIQRQPGVAEAEGEDVSTLRWKLEGEQHWRDAYVVAREDYSAQRTNLLTLLAGAWPDQALARRALAVERLTAQHFGVPAGTEVIVEFGRYERRLPVEGMVRSAQIQPPQLGGHPVFYATQETVAWLTGQNAGYNRINIQLTSFSPQSAVEARQRLQERLESLGVYVGAYEIFDPQIHWLQEQVDAVMLILAALGALSLGLSGFLIVNTMNAIVAQQIRQIGVMKTVGATGMRVTRVYLATALVYGLLSLSLAVPIGAVAAHLLARELLNLLNIDVGPFHLVPAAAGIQVTVGLAVPVLATLVPVIAGACVTVRRAISDYGLGAGFGSNWLDRLIGRVRHLPRPLALSLRNTFRRKARITMTLLALVLGGMMFMVVMSVRSSVDQTIVTLLDDMDLDVLVSFRRMYRVSQLVEVAESVPGVSRAEVWGRWQGAQLALDTPGDEARTMHLWGVPSDSEMFNPEIVEGRALLPGDDRAILLNSKIAAEEHIQVGDQVELTLGDRKTTWTVVGLIFALGNQQQESYVSFDGLARATGETGRGFVVLTRTERCDLATQQRLKQALYETYTAHRMEVGGVRSSGDVRREIESEFNLIVYLMLAMAVLAAVVGGVGLASTMAINVVERAREIGVLRAIGATTAAVAGIVVAEGVLVGVLSWLLAVPFSYPGARVLSDVVGLAWSNRPLQFSYSVSGLALWLAVVTALSALSSLWPALRATRVTIREALAYE